MVRDNFGVRVEDQSALAGHLGLGFAHVLFVEEELAIQIRYIDCVQIDDLQGLRAQNVIVTR